MSLVFWQICNDFRLATFSTESVTNCPKRASSPPFVCQFRTSGSSPAGRKRTRKFGGVGSAFNRVSEALTCAARQNSEVHSATVRAIGSPMSKRQPEKTSIARRKLLAGGVVLAGSAASAALSTAYAGAADDNLPPHVPAWMKEQGAVSQPALWSTVPIREERHPPCRTLPATRVFSTSITLSRYGSRPPIVHRRRRRQRRSSQVKDRGTKGAAGRLETGI